MADLKAKFDAVLMAQLDKIDEMVEVHDGKATAKVPLYDAKSRIALLAEVRQYLAESGPQYGRKL